MGNSHEGIGNSKEVRGKSKQTPAFSAKRQAFNLQKNVIPSDLQPLNCHSERSDLHPQKNCHSERSEESNLFTLGT